MPEDTQTVEPSLEEQLTAVMKPKDAAPAEPGSAATPSEPTSPAPEAPSEEAEQPQEPSAEDELKKIAEETPAEPETQKPALSEEQQKILAMIPNTQIAEQVQTLATGYHNFTSAFAKGEFDNVTEMLQSWNPQAWDLFEEHLYQKKVASGEWIDRWIQDKDGNATVNSGMKALHTEIANLKSTLAQQQQRESQQRDEAHRAEIGRQYNAHVSALFDRIKTPEEDRPRIKRLLDVTVGTNKSVLARINAGDMKAVNKIFAEEVTAYNKRDQQITEKNEKTFAVQDKKKPLVSAATVTRATEITDEMIQQAPPEQRDELLDRQMKDRLANFMKKK